MTDTTATKTEAAAHVHGENCDHGHGEAGHDHAGHDHAGHDHADHKHDDLP